MEQRLSFITLGVKNLPAMKAFYTNQFGWQPMKQDGGIVFFQLNGIILGLYPTGELAADAKADPAENTGNKFKGFTLAINFRSDAEVDAVFAELKARGVTVAKAPEKVFWGGYSGYVSDIEGNLWEIAHNPFIQLDAAGNIIPGE
jgi:catechol 2,3-dioxygenase-like lactoylglutathione lyase family enzyme